MHLSEGKSEVAGFTETEMVTPSGKLTSSATMRCRASGVRGAAEE